MKLWKEFGQNSVTHSAAHHLVAIDRLIEEYGYARVTDVAKRLAITRGSASITLRNLKARGLAEADARGFLRLSAEGRRIVHAVRAKKSVMRKLFADLLGVGDEQANVDACKIEHLISGETVERITRLLRFLQSGNGESRRFLDALAAFDDDCGHDPKECTICNDDCLARNATEGAGESDGADRKGE